MIFDDEGLFNSIMIHALSKVGDAPTHAKYHHKLKNLAQVNFIRVGKTLWNSDSAEITHEKMLDRAAVLYELMAFYSANDEPTTSLKRKAP